AIGSLLFFSPAPSPPKLVLTGYERFATNANEKAKLELRNTTGRVIWLIYSGSGSPLKPPLMERPTVPPPLPTNGSNVYELHLGSFFMQGEKVLPGNTVRLEIPVRSEESPKQVGLSYYIGKFSDETDFLNHVCTPLPSNSGNLKDRAVYYWQRFRRKLRTPE